VSTSLDVFPLTIENGVAVERLRELAADAIVCTMAEPWALVADAVPMPAHRIECLSVELADLRTVADGVPAGAGAVIGMGGGTAIDTAKFVAQTTGLPLIQIPTIISVDAAFTAPYGYRDGSRVRYAGDLRPVEVICDPNLIRRAPAALNRAGVGDLLSCHTGMHDWRLAVDGGRGDIPWNDDAVALGCRVLEEMDVAAPEIHAVSEAGIRWLAETHRDVGAGCISYGARFEEGSEHFLAYTFEWLTNEHRVHGELISCCAIAMSYVQDNDPDRIVELVRRTGVDARLSHLGISADLFVRMCAELPGYAQREHLWPSVIETVEWTDELASRTFEHVRRATGD
jgi:glycerol dehydrogenase-like iron-containing ADH family enzyme